MQKSTDFCRSYTNSWSINHKKPVQKNSELLSVLGYTISMRKIEEREVKTEATPERLMQLAATGLLGERSLDRALRLIGHRPGRRDWLRFLEMILLVLGALFLLAGVIFFFAYNWSDLHRFAKLGLVQAAILLAAAIAHYVGLEKLVGKIALTSAAVLFGPLLAVFGQIYQTGADAYTLFVTWALLSVGLVLVGRFAPLWLLFQLLLNVTIALYIEQVWGAADLPIGQSLFLLNALFLIGWEVANVRGIRWVQARWPAQLAAAAAFVTITYDTTRFIFDSRHWDSMQPFAPAAALLYLIFTVAVLYVYTRKIPDLLLLTMSMLSLIVVVGSVVGRLLDFDETIVFLLGGFIVIVQAALAVTWLRRVSQRWEEAT